MYTNQFRAEGAHLSWWDTVQCSVDSVPSRTMPKSTEMSVAQKSALSWPWEDIKLCQARSFQNRENRHQSSKTASGTGVLLPALRARICLYVLISSRRMLCSAGLWNIRMHLFSWKPTGECPNLNFTPNIHSSLRQMPVQRALELFCTRAGEWKGSSCCICVKIPFSQWA